jgi:hypothetical protein
MAEKLNKDAVYRAAKSKDKDYTINEGGGLVLLVKSRGVMLWRFIYRFEFAIYHLTMILKIG